MQAASCSDITSWQQGSTLPAQLAPGWLFCAATAAKLTPLLSWLQQLWSSGSILVTWLRLDDPLISNIASASQTTAALPQTSELTQQLQIAVGSCCCQLLRWPVQMSFPCFLPSAPLTHHGPECDLIDSPSGLTIVYMLLLFIQCAWHPANQIIQLCVPVPHIVHTNDHNLHILK